MAMTDKTLRIQLLGGFSMYYGDEALALNKTGGSKSIRLLQMLLLSLAGGIPKGSCLTAFMGGTRKRIRPTVIRI